MKYTGSCHCGNVGFNVEAEIEQVMECNCSICSKLGYLLIFVPESNFTLNTPKENYSSYAFNDKTIDHNFCTNCGCSTFGAGADEDGNTMIAVNVRCLDELSLSELKIEPFDGRSL